MKKILIISAIFNFLWPCFGVTNKITTGDFEFDMVEIPRTDFQMMSTEVTQKMYETVMGKLPEGNNEGEKFPVKNVSFLQALVFCNKLSEYCGMKPVYYIKGVEDLNDILSLNCDDKEAAINMIKIDDKADGFKLPTEKEWKVAANGGNPDFRDRIGKKYDDFSWVFQNSEKRVHQVALKKPNNFGLYDLTGNLAEWVYEKADFFPSANRVIKGSHYKEFPQDLLYRNSTFAGNYYDWVGIRIISKKIFK